MYFLDWIWRTNMSQGTLEHNWIHAKIKSNSCFRFKCWFQFRFVCKKSSRRYMPSSPWQVILGGKSLTGQFNIENCWFNSIEAWMNAFNVSNFGSLVRNAFVRKTHINERNWNFFAIYTKEMLFLEKFTLLGKILHCCRLWRQWQISPEPRWPKEYHVFSMLSVPFQRTNGVCTFNSKANRAHWMMTVRSRAERDHWAYCHQ